MSQATKTSTLASAAKTAAARKKKTGSSPKGKKPLLPLLDWDKLTFAFTVTDVMYLSHGDREQDPIWDGGKFLPLGTVTLSPAAAFLSYGVGVFEGLKAQRSKDGRILVFRHRDNGLRMQRSAERLLMPPFPVEQFMSAVEGIVARNARFVPPHGRGSFYVRPMQHAIEAKLGLGPCSKFWVLIYGSPVGGYFATKRDSKGPEGVRLRVLEQGRVAAGGTGSAKAMGNYAGGITIASRWKKEGYDDVLYLDAHELKHLTETSGSNVFVKMKDGTLVTPAADDQILPGITRDSVIQVARRILGLKVEERLLPLEEALSNGEEMFCTGTAWTVQSVREVVHHEQAYAFPATGLRQALLSEILGIQLGEKNDPFGWITEIKG
ncbi:MAG: branched-chain-amino-acid transaminase [Planctomycetes bacterium]|nr:branched-chain-amino-acid transaminase [Planctomycetota bacterium]